MIQISEHSPKRGAISLAAFGLGVGLSLGLLVDIAILTLQGGQVPDLIGSLGLPGAILSLVGAFFLGAKAWQTLKANGKSGEGSLEAERRTTTAVDKVIERIDTLRDELRAGQKENRHDVRNALATVQSEVLLAVRHLRDDLKDQR